MKILSIPYSATIAMAAIALGSCASVQGFPDRPDNRSESVKLLQKEYAIEAVLKQYKTLTTDDARMAYRNEVIAGRMMAIDLEFSEFQKDIYSQGVSTNLGFGLAEQAMSIGGTLSAKAAASQIFSAVGGAVSGINSVVGNTLYDGQALPAILSVMSAERTQIRVRLEKGEALDLSDYPITRALSDLEQYYTAGTIPGALQSMTANAGEKQAVAENELSRVISSKYQSVEGQALSDELLNIIDNTTAFPDGKALEILKAPPSRLDPFLTNAITQTLGGQPMSSITSDAVARQTLKYIVVFINESPSQDLPLWASAIKSRATP